MRKRQTQNRRFKELREAKAKTVSKLMTATWTTNDQTLEENEGERM